MRKFLLLITIGILSFNTTSAQEGEGYEKLNAILNDVQKADSTSQKAQPEAPADVAPKKSDKSRTPAPLEVMPKFRGAAFNTFGAWVASQVQYPKEALDSYIEGTVVITFAVEKDGTLGDMDIVSSPSDLLSREALRIVILSPKWTPGVSEGAKVRVYVQIPVVFKLDKKTLRKRAKELGR